MTQEQIAEIVEEIKPRIKEQLLKATVEKLASTLEWPIIEAIKETAKEYCEQEIVPAVRERLAAQREDLIAGVVAGVSTLGPALTKAIVDHVEKVMTDDYKRGQLVEKIFGRGY